MKQIYLVTEGEYSDYRILGAFSTAKKAKEFVDAPDADGWATTARMIEIYHIDHPNRNNERTFTQYHVLVFSSGAAQMKYWTDDENPPDSKLYKVFAQREEQAIKIAKERWAKERAREEGLS